MTITCFIRYEIDPFKKDQFTAYSENWARIIPRLGGHLLGYFVPHEGSNYEAWGLISFSSLAAYEAYRQRLREDDEAQANFAFAKQERFILKEERSFPQPVPASYLLAGDYASAGELARAASVTPATASGHLGKLMAAELLVCEQRGRHRYYRLADDEVAHALEAVALIAERRTHTAAWAKPTRQRLRFARCCYGHLAGQLGVELFSQLLSKEWLAPVSDGYLLTAQGKASLSTLGFAVDGMDKARLPLTAWPTVASIGPNAATTWQASCPRHCWRTACNKAGCAASTASAR